MKIKNANVPQKVMLWIMKILRNVIVVKVASAPKRDVKRKLI